MTYFHKVPIILHYDLQRESHQISRQVEVTRDEMSNTTYCSDSAKYKNCADS